MVSVILRNRNEEDYIGFSIQSVVEHIPDAEILVIDNNSTDDSMQIVNLFSDRIKISTFSINDYSPGSSLNFGVSKCSFDKVLILSAHSQITKLNLDSVFNSLLDHSAVFGKQTPIYKGKKISTRYIWSHFKDSQEVNMFSNIENRQFLHNAFCFYNKHNLQSHPFDENLAGKEDRYWAIDAVKRSDSYLYDPNLQCNHFYTKNGATWKGIG